MNDRIQCAVRTRHRLDTSQRRSLTRLVPCLIAALCLASCTIYPDTDERLDDDIVFTNHAKDADFGAYKTFAVDPEVHRVVIESSGDIEMGTLDDSTSKKLVDRLVSNMKSRGFTQVDVSEKPDLGLTLTAIRGEVGGSVSSSYWYGYYGYYWGYPGYGYYYPYEIYYTYETGTLITDMVDLVAARENAPDGGLPPGDADAGPILGGLPGVWTGVAYKTLIDDELTSERVAAAQQAIDQEFKQSPYLRSE